MDGRFFGGGGGAFLRLVKGESTKMANDWFELKSNGERAVGRPIGSGDGG